MPKIYLAASRAEVGAGFGGTSVVNAVGRREFLGPKVGNSETESFWAQSISYLKAHVLRREHGRHPGARRHP